MNTFSLPKTTRSQSALVANSLSDVVEVPLSEQFDPILIELDQHFGATELSYDAAVESASVVELKLLRRRGILVLMPAEGCVVDRSTRIVVRATTDDGISTVSVFNVKVVESQPVAA